jgi:hypothetical protein
MAETTVLRVRLEDVRSALASGRAPTRAVQSIPRRVTLACICIHTRRLITVTQSDLQTLVSLSTSQQERRKAASALLKRRRSILRHLGILRHGLG